MLTVANTVVLHYSAPFKGTTTIDNVNSTPTSISLHLSKAHTAQHPKNNNAQTKHQTITKKPSKNINNITMNVHFTFR